MMSVYGTIPIKEEKLFFIYLSQILWLESSKLDRLTREKQKFRLRPHYTGVLVTSNSKEWLEVGLVIESKEK